MKNKTLQIIICFTGLTTVLSGAYTMVTSLRHFGMISTNFASNHGYKDE